VTEKDLFSFAAQESAAADEPSDRKLTGALRQ